MNHLELNQLWRCQTYDSALTWQVVQLDDDGTAQLREMDHDDEVMRVEPADREQFFADYASVGQLSPEWASELEAQRVAAQRKR